jgi:hypothetical protein
VLLAEAVPDGHTRFVMATSRWSRRQRVPELEIRTLEYEPVPGAIDQYSLEVAGVDSLGVAVEEVLDRARAVRHAD